MKIIRNIQNNFVYLYKYKNMEINQGIYQIVNIVNKQKYIGSSLNIENRKKNHFKTLKNNCHVNKYLQNSYNKYGGDKFIFEILEINNNLTRNELYELEQYYIDLHDFDNLFNISKDVKGGGSEALCIPILLLDLDGNILNNFDSLQDCSRYFKTSQIQSNKINSNSLYLNKYRIVDEKFYDNNLNEILSWKNKEKELLLKEEEFEEYRRLNKIVYLDIDNKTYRFETLQEASNFVELSLERVRQMINSDWTINQKYKFYNLANKDLKYEKLSILINNIKNKPSKTKYDKYYKFDETLNKWIVFTEEEIIAEVNNKKDALMISRCLYKTLNSD